MAEREINEAGKRIVAEFLEIETEGFERAHVDIDFVRLDSFTLVYKREVATARTFLRSKAPHTRTSREEELLKFLAQWIDEMSAKPKRTAWETNHGWKKLPPAAAPGGRTKGLGWGGAGYSPACFVPSNLSNLGMRDPVESEAPDAPEVASTGEPIPAGELTASFEERAKVFHESRPPDATDQEWAALEAEVLRALSLRETAKVQGVSHMQVKRLRNQAREKLAARVNFEKLFAASDQEGEAQEPCFQEIGTEPKRGAGPEVFEQIEAGYDDPGDEEK